MKERDCENCVHHTEDGCSSWDCEFEKAMTREEAIKTLERVKDGGVVVNLNDAIDMAIEALSAKPTISMFAESEEAYKAWTGEEMGKTGDEINEMDREIIKDILKMMPTAYLLEALGVSTFEELTEQADRLHGRLIDADALLDKLPKEYLGSTVHLLINNAPTVSADRPHGDWIPCSERLPKINQRVLLATNDGRVFVGYREKPDLVWQVTETDGRKHWVYDPENYTDDIEVLPKNEDCGFAKDDVYSDGFLSVTSINYDDRFEGVTAWMPLPTPYKGGDDE